MEKKLSTTIALGLEYATRIMEHVNTGQHITNAAFTAHAHATADHMAILFRNHDLCSDGAVPFVRESFQARIAEIFTKGVHGVAKLEDITPEASHLLIDINPRHAYKVVMAIAAYAGSGFADEAPEWVNEHVDCSADPAARARTIGEHRQMVARMQG